MPAILGVKDGGHTSLKVWIKELMGQGVPTHNIARKENYHG